MSTSDMAKAYEAQQVEHRLYAWWEQSGFFTPMIDPERRPFTISIPPPNVTGELHVGHAMFVTLEDVIIRWRRMQGSPTLWLPGTDHAGIATQLQVEKMLEREGTSRQQIGREQFLERTWAWKEKYGGEITRQIRRLGASCDWSRERFTLDPLLSRAVRAAFKRLYDDGLIYRGTRLINWSPRLQTAVSDLEVEYQERQVRMYHVRYPVAPADGSWTPGAHPWGSGRWADGAGEFIVVATTRPETIMGDTAVAVNPADPRYQHLVGRAVILPAIGRLVPVVADEYADPQFGTGAVKITPAHDPNDYQVGLRHGLPLVNILNNDATLNEHGGPYAGLDRYDARTALLADLEREGLLVETRPHTMSVGVSQRGGEVIEPLLSEQWFVRMKPLAELAIAAVREGRTRIIPDYQERIFFNWLEKIEDWCISRQLWWGHRIPVWYLPDGRMVVLGPDDPEPHEPGAVQDPDVLDTWFSSGLWPFSTLGWPDDTADYRYFYPTSVMETGYDILFFWVARMMMLGCYLTGQTPFHTVYLHGLVRDEFGRKMSKTYGNVVNPVEVMEQYGTDALRFTLATSSTPGQDVNLNPQRIEASRNFANKLWNIARFVLTRLQPDPLAARSTLPEPADRAAALTLADRWILARYHTLVREVDRLMESYNFGEAGRQVHDFLWSEFADWYVEVAKVQLEAGEPACQATRAVLFHVLDGALRLLHPFMPFVTEEVWQWLHGRGGQPLTPETPALMMQPYPVADERWIDPGAAEDFELVRAIVRGVRDLRNQYAVEPGRPIAAILVGGTRSAVLHSQAPVLARLARISPEQLVVHAALENPPPQAAALVLGEVQVYLPLAGMIDLASERQRLSTELEQARAEIARRQAKLADEKFVGRAPATIVQRERDGLSAAQARAAGLEEQLARLG